MDKMRSEKGSSSGSSDERKNPHQNDIAEEDAQLSGTDFLDMAFFGNKLKHHEDIMSEQNPSHSYDFFEENFFKKKSLKYIEDHQDETKKRAPIKGSRKHVEKSIWERKEGTFGPSEVENDFEVCSNDKVKLFF
ncbi:unnamed protein product [Strongylus vulgaris]|uniref:Uncharacterized protein n=1 Tax=Strongylus vulgaris TaxID=40348 RepID=A0A3P7JV58_STRVU|nr:unnamed protein product [Strongylus vulgaris]